MSSAGLRIRFSRFLFRRSAIRLHLFPTRKNTIQALLLVLLALPFSILLTPILSLRRLVSAPPKLLVLATGGEFGPFVHLLELVRGGTIRTESTKVLVLSKYRHETLAELYEDELGVQIYWGGGIRTFIQQVWLLLPEWCTELEQFSNMYTFQVHARLPSTAVRVPQHIANLRTLTLRELGIQETNYVSLAVFALKYDEERNPHYLSTLSGVESIGTEMAAGIDFLSSEGVDIVLLGSPDTGRSYIPRPIVRLNEFGELGGPHEIAVASGSRYFWTDNVGAWWTTAPFCTPVLHSNASLVLSWNMRQNHVVVPVRYVTPEGDLLSLKELLKFEGSPYRAFMRGELSIVRNSSSDLQEAHREMLSRANGTWFDGKDVVELREQVNHLYSSLTTYPSLNFASTFLERHSDFIR